MVTGLLHRVGFPMELLTKLEVEEKLRGQVSYIMKSRQEGEWEEDFKWRDSTKGYGGSL